MYRLLNFITLAQTEPTGGTSAGGDSGLLGLFGNPMFPLLIIGVLFYFLLILPERKKRKELDAKLSELKKNDPVVTTGGIYGVIVSATPGSKDVTIRIDDNNNTRIRVLRSHIAHIGPLEKADEKDIQEKKES
jgi:preprotein translocase subunit YajC